MHTVLSQSCLLLKWKPSGCQKAVVAQSISLAHLATAYRAQTGQHVQALDALGGRFSVAHTLTEGKESISKALFGLTVFQKAFYFL